jgi:antitoxin MazE
MSVAAKTQIAKWGHSLAVRIPKPVAQSVRLREGDHLTVAASNDGAIVIRPARREYRLEDLVAKITRRNRHEETNWGKRVGKENW